jgi:acetyl-CoA carboxylase biotin carboxyl carrier protein
MSLSPDDVKVLVQAFEASDWDEMSVRFGDTALELTRTGRPPTAHAAPGAPAAVAPPAAAPAAVAAPAAAAPAAATSAPATAAAANIPDGHVISAPSLGLFWRSPQPGAPAFVEVGQHVNAEDTVCIVEVMKLMNHVKAGATGTVAAIVPGNGEMVEFGVPLVVITPDA